MDRVIRGSIQTRVAGEEPGWASRHAAGLQDSPGPRLAVSWWVGSQPVGGAHPHQLGRATSYMVGGRDQGLTMCVAHTCASSSDEA